MNKKIVVAGLCLALIACALVGGYYFNNNNGNKAVKGHSLGKTPHCPQCTFGEDFVLYKNYVSKNDEKVFRGLYRYNLNDNRDSGKKSQLLSDSYYACANIYQDKVIFINEEYNIQQVDLENNNSEILYDNKGGTITDALIVDDNLYFIAGNGTGDCNLLAINLTDHTQKQMIEDVNWGYLFHFGEGVAVQTRDNKFLVKCDFDNGITEKYPLPEDEIMGFLDDGSILLAANLDTVYQLKDFHTDQKTVLMQKENIYKIIMHPDEMLVCTLNDYGLLEIYIYDFASKKESKIANANAEPRDFNKEYIICDNEGVGMPDLINRNTGEFQNIVTDNTREEWDEVKKDVSIEELGGGDYKNALSDDELNDLVEIVKQCYQNKLLDYRIADDDHSLYQQHNDYEMGNIIVFEVHTTVDLDVYRSIAIARENDEAEWKVINEGI